MSLNRIKLITNAVRVNISCIYDKKVYTKFRTSWSAHREHTTSVLMSRCCDVAIFNDNYPSSTACHPTSFSTTRNSSKTPYLAKKKINIWTRSIKFTKSIIWVKSPHIFRLSNEGDHLRLNWCSRIELTGMLWSGSHYSLQFCIMGTLLCSIADWFQYNKFLISSGYLTFWVEERLILPWSSGWWGRCLFASTRVSALSWCIRLTVLVTEGYSIACTSWWTCCCAPLTKALSASKLYYRRQVRNVPQTWLSAWLVGRCLVKESERSENTALRCCESGPNKSLWPQYCCGESVFGKCS